MKKSLIAALTTAALLAAGLTWATSPSSAAEDEPVRTITLSGQMTGPSETTGYAIEPKAKLFTSTKYKESWLIVTVKITDKELVGRRSPLVTVDLDGSKVNCEIIKGWIWSTKQGSDLSLKCDGYLSPKKAKKIMTGVVIPSY
jgi:hypothetical protein